MDPEEEPGPLESLEEVGFGIAHGIARLLDRIPFLSKGVFPLVFGPIMLLGLYVQILGLANALESDIAVQTWQPTRAVVTASGRSWDTTKPLTGHTTSGPTEGIDVTYRYIFKGKVYESSSFGLGSWTAFSGEAGLSSAEWVEQHPKESVITAFVNPRHPEVSAIDPRPTLSALLYMLLGLPLTLVGLSGVLTEEAQTKLSFEAISVGWSVLVLVMYLVGHALTIGVIVSLAAYLGLLWVLHRWVAKSPTTQVEEDLDAPPQDIADFSG